MSHFLYKPAISRLLRIYTCWQTQRKPQSLTSRPLMHFMTHKRGLLSDKTLHQDAKTR
jgi:hypothetical protein